MQDCCRILLGLQPVTAIPKSPFYVFLLRFTNLLFQGPGISGCPSMYEIKFHNHKKLSTLCKTAKYVKISKLYKNL
jgi:hypothetical protein